MKTLSTLLLAIALVTVPLITGCFQCEEAAWSRYAEDRAPVSVGATTPTLVPITISVPPSAPGTAHTSVGVEIAMTDCAAGEFDLGVRLLARDGREISAREGFRTSTTEPFALRCPTTPVVFEVAPTDLPCTDARCSASFSIELTSETGVGPRELEARLVEDTCSAASRGDATIDAFGT